jgi:hypothetical protein
LLLARFRRSELAALEAQNMATGNGSKQLRRYSLRTERGRWLAEVVISDDGYFSTVSDYGNYVYFWGSAGVCFRSFLAQLDASYLLGKLSPKMEYDAPGTLKEIKSHILSERKFGWMDREKARKEWDLLAEHNDLRDPEDFSSWVRDTEFSDAWEMGCERHAPQASAFAERVWPIFAVALRAEVNAEREAVSA